MKKIFFILFFLTVSVFFNQFDAQVGINTSNPDPTSVLDIIAKNSDKGLLIPRIPLTSLTDISTIPNPTVSLLVYNTTTNTEIIPGYYYWNGVKWLKFSDKSERIFYGTIDPLPTAASQAGDIYVNSATGIIFAFDGTNWISQVSTVDLKMVKIIANDGQTTFSTPWDVSANNVKVYRNGVNIDFTISAAKTVTVESGATCYQNDEIKIYKFL